MVRRLFYIILSLLGLLTILLALHPWILAWAVPHVARSLGFEVGSSKAQGYRWLTVQQLKGKIKESSVAIDQVTIRQPLAWLIDLRRPDEVHSPFIKAEGVEVDVVPTPDEDKERTSPQEAHKIATRALDEVSRWAPWLEAERIIVSFRQHKIIFNEATFREGILTAEGLAPQQEIQFHARADGLRLISFEAIQLPYIGAFAGEASVSELGQGYQFHAKVTSEQGSVDAYASVAPDSWVPYEAKFLAPDFVIPPELFGANSIGEIRGQATAAWNGDNWGLDATVNGQVTLPLPSSDSAAIDKASDAEAPVDATTYPISLSLRAVGDFEKAALNQVLLKSPLGDLELLRPTVLSPEPPFLLTEETAVRLRIDPHRLGFEEVPSPLFGRFQVKLEEHDGGGLYPSLRFSGRTSSVGRVQGRDIELQLSGLLQWPLLQLSKFEADLGEESAFTARAEVDFKRGEIHSASGVLRVGPEWLLHYLPEDARIDSALIQWTASGPLKTPQHNGAINLKSPAWQEHSVSELEAHWRGRGLESLSISLSAHDNLDQQLMALELGLEGAPPNVGETLAVSMGLEIAGNLAQGELTGQVVVNASENGIDVRTADISLGPEPILHSTGYLPFTIARTEEGIRVEKLSSSQQLSFVLDAQIREEVHRLFPLGLPLEIGSITAQASLEGTPESPRGFVNLRVDRIVPPEVAEGVRPEIEQLELSLSATKDQFQIDELRVLVNQQPLIATAELPVGEDWLATLQDHPLELTKAASARVLMQNYPLGILEHFLPRTFAETGSLSVDISLRQGLSIEGQLDVKGLRTRPLEGGATLTINQARIILDGRQARIASFDALLGRRQLQLEGSIDFQDFSQPTGNLRLEGERLPLLLLDSLILRGDLLAEIILPKDDTPLIRGKLNLREGLVLQDLRSLTGGPEGAPVRPPYFSVEAHPFNTWRMNIEVTGKNFLRVETPVFSGKISADATISRTLGNPLLVGEAAIETGVIRFPFASLRVENGHAYITRQEPHMLQLDVPAEGGTAGYTINMHVGGNSENPEIEFTSTPPLQQEQILLLVTAGILPENDDLGRSQAQQLALYLGKGLFRDLTGPGSGEGIGDRLTVESGRSLSERGRETYSVEYELTDRLSIEGGYDIYDQYNIGIRWNILEK